MAMGITPFYSYFCSIIRFLLIKFPVFIKAFTFSLGIVYAVDLTASIRSRVWMTHNHGTRIVSERGNLQNRENRRDPLYAAYSVDKHYHLFKWLLNAIITKYADAFFNIPLSISPHFQYPPTFNIPLPVSMPASHVPTSHPFALQRQSEQHIYQNRALLAGTTCAP